MVRASDSGSGDLGSILGRVGVFFLWQETFTPKKVLVIPSRNRWLRLNMTEKLFTGTLNKNQNKTKTLFKSEVSSLFSSPMRWLDTRNFGFKKYFSPKVRICLINIMLTCPCYLHPIIPHFYILKLGFTGVYIIFKKNCSKHRS